MRMLLGLLVLAETVMLLQAPRTAPAAPPTPPALAAPAPTPSGPRLTYMQALQRQTERVRGLSFKQDVVQEKRTRAQTRKFLKDELAKEDMTPDDVTLKALGLIDDSSSLHDLILHLYSAQVAGFYNPATRRFYMVAQPQSGILAPLTGTVSSVVETLTGANEINMIHELDHALTDQHFDLEKYMHPKRKGRPVANDDEEIARQCVVEGDATMVMIHAQRRQMGLDFDFMRLDGDELDSMTEMLSWLPGLGQEELFAAPLYLRRRLIFPYFYGAEFMDHLRHTPRGVDAAYTTPPRSTAQILHTALYDDGPRHEDPLGTPKDVLPAEVAGWRLRNSNVFGEFRLNVLFEKAIGSKRDHAAGWRGDRFWVYSRDGQYAILWGSTWQSRVAARYAAQRFTFRMVRRYGFEVSPDLGRLWTAQPGLTRARWSRVVNGRLYSVQLDGTEVRVEEGVPTALAARWQGLRLRWRDEGPAR